MNKRVIGASIFFERIKIGCLSDLFYEDGLSA